MNENIDREIAWLEAVWQQMILDGEV